ncbi:hypothetical protein MLD38_018288 [Melastoma candidum]|uniref:Uncharacterized protein n=1 Tax=Melastoma candidum TaxID=119954 RepID=A0ACB9QUG5_9MYRT|nr:hypothetical protein MLD38_018288 [Melastoma candidum]
MKSRHDRDSYSRRISVESSNAGPSSSTWQLSGKSLLGCKMPSCCEKINRPNNPVQWAYIERTWGIDGLGWARLWDILGPIHLNRRSEKEVVKQAIARTPARLGGPNSNECLDLAMQKSEQRRRLVPIALSSLQWIGECVAMWWRPNFETVM